MAKSNNLKALFEISKELDPFSVFQTEFGFLKLTDRQKSLVQEKVFAPGKHIFAYISGPDGIRCVEVCAEHPNTFKKFVDEHEKSSLAYAYLGVSNPEGKVDI